MKIGIIGAGNVGAATLMALLPRKLAQEIVIIDKNTARAEAIALDAQYGAALDMRTKIYQGDYVDLKNAGMVIVTAGINEKTGGATNKNDPAGRLVLLKTNVGVYQDIVPKIAQVAPNAIILVVTDPPDPLADVARQLAPKNIVLSAGTFLDSLRFRFYIAEFFGVDPMSVAANVVGEHGTSEVFLWSSVNVGGVPLPTLLKQKQQDQAQFQQKVEQSVRFANINIIAGNNASQYGVGMATAYIAEACLLDRKIVMPIGVYNPKYEVTLSLPSVVGRDGVSEIFEPEMTSDERKALEASAKVLREALAPK